MSSLAQVMLHNHFPVYKALVQIKVSHPLGVKPLPRPVMAFCQWERWEQTAMIFESEWKYSLISFQNMHLNMSASAKWVPFCHEHTKLKPICRWTPDESVVMREKMYSELYVGNDVSFENTVFSVEISKMNWEHVSSMVYANQLHNQICAQGWIYSLCCYLRVWTAFILLQQSCQVTLDISGSPIESQWGSRKYPR